jgi:hypothetical protein
VTQEHLDDTDVLVMLEQMRGKGVATSIVTLLMIRGLFKSTTGTIRTMASSSTLSAACDVNAMKHSS